jgi:putative ABC transport system substrate-binding protein
MYEGRHSQMLSRTSRWFVAIALAAWTFVLADHALADTPPGTVARIGLVGNRTPQDARRALSALREELKNLGYTEGRNLYIEERWANGESARLPQLVAELIQRKVDVIVATSTQVTDIAKKATSTVPIVMVVVADPVGTGLVSNLAHPEGNVTGLSIMTIDLSIKRLQLLKDAIPGITRVAVLWNPDHPFHSKVVEALKRDAPSLSVEPTFLSAQTPDELRAAFASARRARVQGLYVIEDSFFYHYRANISQLASKARLPAVYGAREYADAGGLMSYGPNYEHLYRRAAGYVDKILKGARPSELPIEQPTRFEFIVNLRSAKLLGITVPQAVSLRADEVIQ